MTSDNTLFSSPKTLKTVMVIFAIFLGCLLGADFLIHPHASFTVDGWPEFNPLFGFLSGLALPVIALGLSFLVKNGK
ncbi:hypothetical protein [Desulfoluna spongiiphila]|uniref:Uncharacterized protein n=1 Tax=Desulfoluna spongiiphila TaxID=419481 RepID=A0A1G5IUT1_9BACT|nr:hypothetical protein [Desulfoluna spongiiphila]SCY79855.1 hypothetical protein SAMN05216233_12247 [Desulfoluna spongiiphila]VVS93338.1 hypothetical protein DBB_29060 [Desulfoluna spongiiphila]